MRVYDYRNLQVWSVPPEEFDRERIAKGGDPSKGVEELVFVQQEEGRPSPFIFSELADGPFNPILRVMAKKSEEKRERG